MKPDWKYNIKRCIRKVKPKFFWCPDVVVVYWLDFEFILPRWF